VIPAIRAASRYCADSSTASDLAAGGGDDGPGGGGGSGAGGDPGDAFGGGGGGEGRNVDEARAVQLYRQMRGWVMSEHVAVRRSPIHGWGLFLRQEKPRDTALIEYTGAMVREPVANRREVSYEEEARLGGRFAHMQGAGTGAGAGAGAARGSGGFDLATVFKVPGLAGRSDGSGSCYLFRLDDDYIIDATVKGSAARFLNHSCEPNCYARFVTVDGERRIVIFSLRALRAGEEATYDYKFAIEADEANRIACYCGAKSCWGRMN
jgi:hypothetical protein